MKIIWNKSIKRYKYVIFLLFIIILFVLYLINFDNKPNSWFYLRPMSNSMSVNKKHIIKSNELQKDMDWSELPEVHNKHRNRILILSEMRSGSTFLGIII